MNLRILARMAAFVWASPYTLLGLAVGSLGLCTGGQVRCRDGVLEFSGGATRWFVTHLPSGSTTLAITFGHVVLGQTEAALDITHDHEMVHVRQYERWGPFLGPAYLLCSAALWLAGRRPYRDNPFEREAYGETDMEDEW
jgi:hypothetical protein